MSDTLPTNAAAPGGKAYWRSLDEISDTPEFRRHLEKEFPSALEQVTDPVSRRKFMGLMGAAVALSGLVGCRRPLAKILPYAKMPEDLLPGVPQYYATSMPFMGMAHGVLVQSHEGRPVKIEGNPEHPASGGATDVFAQAAILELYDPDRSKKPSEGGATKSWAEFQAWWESRSAELSARGGEGLRFLSESSPSPTTRRLRDEVKRAFPRAVWHTYDAVHRDHVIEGSRLAFGRPLRTQINLAQADIILSLDSDFLMTEPNAVAQAREFARRRRVRSEKQGMSRLYMVENGFSVTGSMADHRLRLSHGETLGLLTEVAMELGRRGATISGLALNASTITDPHRKKWAVAAAKDLVRRRRRSVILVGRALPPEVHALAHALNKALGSVGSVVRYTAESDTGNHLGSIRDLAQAMEQGQVDTLFVLGGNPAYDAPSDLNFRDLMGRVPHVVRAGLYNDETSNKSAWQLPVAHSLESWGDGEAWDGTLSIQQPLIAPLYEGKSELEILAMVANLPERDGHKILGRHYRTRWGTAGFDVRWDKALHDGWVPNTTFAEVPAPLDAASISKAVRAGKTTAPTAQSLEVSFYPDRTLWDGRFANNGWLQELPDHMTKITWDNAAIVSPETAAALGAASGDMVSLAVGDRRLNIVLWALPGVAENCVKLPLGYGRTHAGRVGNNTGFNTYLLRTTDASYNAAGGKLTPTGERYPISCTQDHQSMEGRPLVREATLAEYKKHPDFVDHMVEVPEAVTLYKDREYDFSEGYQWGMSIDLNTCIGCNACAIACQSENNIAIVGKDEVARGREMHWIRIDRYYSGTVEEPEAVHQPVPCQQCENAPCESVCPVNATTHSNEGLNEMTYNRCIGTRYCNNNCPYKVRKFNYFNWRKDMTEVEMLAMNPDVTVRTRGVMEKCTYCVQRINRARIDSKNEGRNIQDGEIKTACQQVCPTESIVFGNINDNDSLVSRLKSQNRDYSMLEEINTRPRTTYLAKLRNPNPELENA